MAPSTTMSFVDDELRPSFSSLRVTPTCRRRATNAETPRAPASPGRCARRATNVPAWEPFVIHCLAPLIRQPSPSGRPRVRSEPGVRARLRLGEREGADASPRASGGTKRARCSSVPKARIGSVAALVCTATVTPTPASAARELLEHEDVRGEVGPAPPYSSGRRRPSARARRASRRLAREAVLAVPSAACGSISASREVARQRLDLALLGAELEVHRGLSVVARPEAPTPSFAVVVLLFRSRCLQAERRSPSPESVVRAWSQRPQG